MTLFEELTGLMNRYRFTPNAKAMQFFLINDSALKKILDELGLNADDTVLEINPGSGFLSREIAKQAKLAAVERDERLIRLLSHELPAVNIPHFHNSIEKIGLPKCSKIASTQPYTLNTELMHELFQKGFELAVLVFPKDFAKKFFAEPGYLEYCPLSVISKYFCRASVIAEFTADFFFPKPKGMMQAIRFELRPESMQIPNPLFFQLFVKTLFRYKNKTVRNALLNSFPLLEKELNLSKKDFKKIADSLHLPDKKLYLLSPEGFVDIYRKLFKKN